ncbi:hypothetical protein BJV82DRAFT_663266 [Fennellomyces sp. T-0311]|nr:hypothetical protein BJV82DRAFT_663266 [Fennellomyces sp. T-0311]
MRFSLTSFVFALFSVTIAFARPPEVDQSSGPAISAKEAVTSIKYSGFTARNLDNTKDTESVDTETFKKRHEPDNSGANDEDTPDDGDE